MRKSDFFEPRLIVRCERAENESRSWMPASMLPTPALDPTHWLARPRRAHFRRLAASWKRSRLH